MFRNFLQEFEDLMQGISKKNDAMSPNKMDIYAAAKNTFMSTDEMVESFKNKVQNVAGQGEANVDPQFDKLNSQIDELEMDLDDDDDQFPIDEKLGM